MASTILNLPKLIGLCGDAGAGKDKLAEGIVQTEREFEAARGRREIDKFAKTLKILICMLVNEPITRWEEREWKESPHPLLEGKTPRYAAQTLGTEWGRDLIGENLWVNIAMRRASFYNRVIFTDVRYPNEADAIRKAGGVVVRVVREGVAPPDNAGHASESHKDIHDAVVNNWYKSVEEFQLLGPYQLDGVLLAKFGGSRVPSKSRL
jgi:hypothetical protein